jgi:hypothetical protein
VVLIRPSDIGAGYLRYDGGTLLTVDVIGYFTGDDAEVTTAGLYVPSGPRRLFSGTLEPESPVEVGAVQPASGRALVTFGSPQAPRRGGTFVVPVAGGIVTLGTDEVRQVEVSLMGVFIDR